MTISQATFSEKARFSLNALELKAKGKALNLMPMRDPKVFLGQDSTQLLANEISRTERESAFIITTKGAVKRGQLDAFLQSLKEHNIEYTVFDETIPDPTVAMINEALAVLKSNNCDCIVPFGGGSAMDAAKALSIAARNDQSVEDLIGLRKGKKSPLPLYAIPTTAGTASEVSVVAVVSEDTTHSKRFMVDSRTVARAVALDPKLTATLPQSITAETGMDALTHAMEAYISRLSNSKSDAYALEAISAIFEHLPRAYADGQDLDAREGMAMAALVAGKAFRTALLGYVHAISHQFGALYGTAHGLGNAILLPYVLEYSEDAVRTKLARLAIETGLGNKHLTEATLANRVIEKVQEMNSLLQIPEKAPNLRKQDIPRIARRAYREALGFHAPPKFMGQRDIEDLLHKLL